MKIRRKNSNDDQMIIRVKNLISLLKNVWLNGLIDDCVLRFNGKNAVVEAADLTNTVIVVTEVPVLKSKVNHIELGIGDINILIKFLSTIADDKVISTIDENKFIIQRQDSKRKMIYHLCDISTIPTRIDEKEDETDLREIYIEEQQCKAKLNNIFIKDLLSYIKLLGSKDSSESRQVTVKYDDKITFVCGDENGHQFDLELDSDVKKLSKKVKYFSTTIEGEFLSKVLNTMAFDKENLPNLYISEDEFLTIETEDTFWSISPITGE